MRKSIPCLLLFLTFSSAIWSQIESTFNYTNEGQRVCLVDVSVDVLAASATLHFRDASLNSFHPIAVYRRALYGNGDDWILQVEGLTPGTESWTDDNVNFGEVWEYQVKRANNNGVAIGYAVASIGHDQSAYQGQMILVVSDDYSEALPDEILRLKKDLTADGWFVNELIVAKGSSDLDDGENVVGVKDSISMIYKNAPIDDKPKVLFLLGSVPLPRLGTGMQPPDGHIEASGARGSDSYYADIDGIFTDTATYDVPEQNNILLKNYPDDFKWDQDKIPTELEMAFGRVSFLRVASGVFEDEMEMVKTYLDRLHDFRYVSNGQKIGTKTAFNETGYSNSTDASYRCLPALSGAENVINSSISTPSGHNEWVSQNGPFMWYMSNQHVPQINEWESIGMDALVYSSDQSYFGYGDLPNGSGANNWQANVIRRILGYNTQCLISLWTTSAINVFHQAGVGEPLGYACKHIMDHDVGNQNYEKAVQEWDTPDWWNRTHFNFFRDPTLRLYQTIPARNLQASNNAGEFILNWDVSTDENLIGYHVYKSDSEFGVYQKISDALITDNSFIDPSYQVKDWYMLRAIGEQTTGSGIFLNPSQGIFLQGDIELTSKVSDISAHVKVFPNPAQSIINISSEKAFEKLEIFDINGNRVFAKTFSANKVHKVNIEEFAAGTYLLKTTSGSEFMKRTFVKQ